MGVRTLSAGLPSRVLFTTGNPMQPKERVSIEKAMRSSGQRLGLLLNYMEMLKIILFS
jgi:hypothetical protein